MLFFDVGRTIPGGHFSIGCTESLDWLLTRLPVCTTSLLCQSQIFNSSVIPLFIGVFIRRILHRKLSEWLLIAYHLALLLLVVAAELVNWIERTGNMQRLIGHNAEDSECDGCDPEENAAVQTVANIDVLFQQRLYQRHFVRKTLFFLLILTSVTYSGMLALFILTHG